MSDENGNVLKHKVDELIKWKESQEKLYRNIIQPFIDSTNLTNQFCKDHKDDIQELNVMKATIDNINSKLDKQDSHRRQLTYLVWGAIFTGIAIPIVMRLL